MLSTNPPLPPKSLGMARLYDDPNAHDNLSTIAIVSQEVGTSPRHTRKQTLSAQSLDAGNDRRGSSETLQGNQIQHQPGDVGSGHRRARDGVGGSGRADPSRQDG